MYEKTSRVQKTSCSQSKSPLGEEEIESPLTAGLARNGAPPDTPRMSSTARDELQKFQNRLETMLAEAEQKERDEHGLQNGFGDGAPASTSKFNGLKFRLNFPFGSGVSHRNNDLLSIEICKDDSEISGTF